MTSNKDIVRALGDCFGRQDWHGMVRYLADDVIREEVGAPDLIRGKEEYEKNMAPGAEVESLHSETTRMVEEGNVVVAEGTVLVKKHDGSVIKVRFCNVHEFESGKLKRQTSYTAIV